MTRITLDRATIELLNGLDEPLELLDETGWVLGTFMPKVHETVEVSAPTDKAHLHEVEATLGEEISIYGFEEDLE